MRFAVTTSRHPEAALVRHARARAAQWGLPFELRGRRGTQELLEGYDGLIVLARDSVELVGRQGQLRYSPGMAALRMLRLEARDAANPDRIVSAAELREGDRVLDCTLGLAQDALVVARVVGPKGRVVGVESSLPLFAMVSEGLAIAQADPLSAKVEPAHADALAFLKAQPQDAFDVVYFDPMFDKPRKANAAFDVLRSYGNAEPITAEHLEEARRVARRWVVVKTARHTDALKRLGMEPLPGSRYADVVFGRVSK